MTQHPTTESSAEMSRRDFREWRDRHSSQKKTETAAAPDTTEAPAGAATPAPTPATAPTDTRPITILTVCTGNICR
ncbi:MAG TPA: hypothetical protein DIW46_04255, partial [Microbacterium sp.]|nr:hypothetical protein [Microbacterium sp.]